MGKPFNKELLFLDKTYKWANKVPIDLSKNEIEKFKSLPTFAVGSGGSFSACHMFSILQQSRGGFSKPITPLELHYSREAIRNTNIVFLSASGRNSDILFAYKTAIQQDVQNILGICMKRNTKLSLLSSKYSISKILEFDSPAGKDGFLATNSLIAYFTILSRIFGYQPEIAMLGDYEPLGARIKKFIDQLVTDFTITVLYAGWTQPVAIDIESKFTEAGLGNILVSDYRNFGHGRHNWFDKKKKQSAVVALITPDEEELAQKTLSLLPEYIPKLILSSSYSLSTASLDLLAQSFFLIDSIGEKLGIDPGRPGVPSYGSKLYNLRYESMLNVNKSFKENNIILRKCGRNSIEEMDKSERKFWMDNLNKFRKKINSARFGCIVLDYDGTLSTDDERKSLLSPEIINALNSFLSKGFVVGIVSGRGKSIRNNLQECFDKKYWKNVVIGYYNGGIIASLEDTSQPDISGKPGQTLEALAVLFSKQFFLKKRFTFTLRPLQLTVEKNDIDNWQWLRNFIKEKVEIHRYSDIQLLESSHSIDIILRPQVSKLNILQHCLNICERKGLATNIVCIGDKGRYPGNDYELLATEYSLSVDEVSSDPDTCWNLSELGYKGKLSCLTYLNSAKFTESHFTLSL